jgi:hypothetical protein
MLADIGPVPLECYLYGEEESDEEHEPPVPDADENKTVEEDVDDGDKKPAAVLMEDVFDPDFSQGSTATTDNVNQAITATTANVTQSTTVTTANVAQSFTATTVNVAHSTTAATANVAHSTSGFAQTNTQIAAELAYLSPQMIAEDTVAREMLEENRNNVSKWEGPLLSPQAIQTSCPVFYPIICIQQLTILPFISKDDCRRHHGQGNLGRRLPSRGHIERIRQGQLCTM